MSEIDPNRVKDLELGKDCAAFDVRTGRSYRLNPSGELALRLLQEWMARELAGRFAQHPAVVAAGAEAFVGQLRRYLP